MFSRLLAKLFNRNRPFQYDIYKPKERMIYKYWNGTEMILADPLVLYKKILDRGAELAIDMKVSESPSKDADKAHGAMLEKIRNIFEVTVLSPKGNGGLTETETMDLLNHFLLYCEELKKNSSDYVTSLSNSEDSKLTSADNQIIPNLPGYGSIEKEASTEKLPA